MRGWLWLVVAGCVHSSALVCEDGSICPEGTICARVTNPDSMVCATFEQIAACRDQVADASCLEMGRCYDGVCLPGGCGNGRADPLGGEICDDGNQLAGDGCSADCVSNETCGNRITDVITLEQCDDGGALQNDGCDSGCRLESPSWTNLGLDELPLARWSMTMTYDAAQRRTVLFGGIALTSVLFDDTERWDGAGWSNVHATPRPSQRVGAATAYDAATRRVVLFGGSEAGAALLADTWELDGERWIRRSVTGPSARSGHLMAYDSGLDRVVLFGGTTLQNNQPVQLDDTWIWDGNTWSPLAATAHPTARFSATMAYDPKRNVVVLFGGAVIGPDFPIDLGDTWELDGATWRDVTPPSGGPSPRQGASMAYDPITQRVLLFGGHTDETWSWDGQAWVELAPSVRPPSRERAGIATDVDRNRVVLFGGLSGASPLGDTWEWTGTTWEPRIASTPSPRYGAGIAHDPLAHRAILFGGSSTAAGADLDDTWELADGSWRAVSPATVPPARTGHAMAFDGARVVMLGGTTASSGLLADTWVFDGDWLPQSPTPSMLPRVFHAMAYDAHRNRVVMFGGTGPGPPDLGDTWEWDGTTWTARTPAQAPSARGGHVMAYDPVRQRVVLFGGASIVPELTYADTWEWDGTTWTEVTPVVSPPPRTQASMVWDAARQRLVLLGGRRTNTLLDDIWEWDGTNWTPEFAPVGGPSPRFLSSAVTSLDGHGVDLIGGNFTTAGASVDGAVWRLRWDSSLASETCGGIDTDGDGLLGCTDPDCWTLCTPGCPPGTTCDPAAPRCGDGACDSPRESCRLCPGDCGACATSCGDFVCDPSETCPGDC